MQLQGGTAACTITLREMSLSQNGYRPCIFHLYCPGWPTRDTNKMCVIWWPGTCLSPFFVLDLKHNVLQMVKYEKENVSRTTGVFCCSVKKHVPGFWKMPMDCMLKRQELSWNTRFGTRPELESNHYSSDNQVVSESTDFTCSSMAAPRRHPVTPGAPRRHPRCQRPDASGNQNVLRSYYVRVCFFSKSGTSDHIVQTGANQG